MYRNRPGISTNVPKMTRSSPKNPRALIRRGGPCPPKGAGQMSAHYSSKEPGGDNKAPMRCTKEPSGCFFLSDITEHVQHAKSNSLAP